jgi:glutamate synthase (NADPH/NADH)
MLLFFFWLEFYYEIIFLIFRAMLTLVPEAWQYDDNMSELKKAYYQWNSFAMEPWDGPALLTFTDGRYIGAILDRNGLRPSRYYLLKSNHLIMASEVGVIDVDGFEIAMKGRLKPGRMLLVDTLNREFTSDDKIKNEICRLRPVEEWIKQIISLKDLYEKYHSDEGEKSLAFVPTTDDINEDRRLQLFGYNIEILNLLLLPMIKNCKESLGSMGNDAPLACLSDQNPVIYDYFQQLFAQVTNPPIDPIREKIVMSLSCPIGPESNILIPGVEQCQRLFLQQPILSLQDTTVIKSTTYKNLKPKIIDITVDINEFNRCEDYLSGALDRICQECETAAKENYTVLVLSDRNAGKDRLPVSALLTIGAVHQYLIEKLLRMKVALIIETAEAREIHHICLLLGYGADAICPYLVFETICNLNAAKLLNTTYTNEQIFTNYKYAVQAGIAKVMAKMGISTLQSYKGAQIFEAVGIHQQVIDKCFRGTASRLGGCTFRLFSKEAHNRYLLAYGSSYGGDDRLAVNPGIYHWRSGGEKHINDPEAIAALQDASQTNSRAAYKKFSQFHTEATRNCTIRGQLEIMFDSVDKIDIDLVEPAAEIVKRFATGAMSFGSISIETHTTLAKAMNKMNAKSNTGEGGENLERLLDDDDRSSSTRSSIKQIASGRFGVTSVYLAHADDLQIKMAQGAKPGEGGELPGFKVTDDIAKCRNSVPGVGLISPPPHHDIYSIEDMSELVYDLKCANPKARISVKLVSEVGVGVVASGVAKGKAEHITISGHDGGTGASSWTGIKHAGLPWELGIAETHQTLVLNDLRSRIVLQADGQIRTGIDVAIAGLLGADEFGFATAPLITLGCIMMRKCHLNTCPVGIATQDPVLREKFNGKPEHVINYFFLLAEEVREILAKLGFRKFSDLIGRVDKLAMRKDKLNEKQASLDYSMILADANKMRPEVSIAGGSVKHAYELEKRLDTKILPQCLKVIDGKREEITLDLNITNEDRAFGSTISYYVSIKHKEKGLKDDSIKIFLKGNAGQSFGAFLARGIRLELEGDANDYVGKGLSGGTIIIYPPKSATYLTHNSIIVGNVVLYGAVNGKVFIRGQSAERFCVRNSGAIAVSEGCGDHGCEYMTGGVTIILGSTGRNFAAGMSGGLAYIYDVDAEFPSKCNKESVSLDKLDNSDDLQQVYELLIEFLAHTGSKVAEFILKNWVKETSKFVKVYPHEYRKVLEELKLKEVKVDEVKVVKKMPLVNGVKDIEDTVKKLDKTSGFYKYARNMNQYREVTERVKDWNEIYNHKEVRKHLKKQAARCMDCGVPFCQSKDGCPLGNIVPKWNDLVFHDNWKEALEQLLQTNNFPEFTGRVCPAPCEGACVLGINAKPVTIKNIECAIIDHAYQQGWMRPVVPEKRTGKRIAIVGSGPAGLAAAAQLNKAGHLVTVYERNDVIGGLLRYGIPTMKLSKEVLLVHTCN